MPDPPRDKEQSELNPRKIRSFFTYIYPDAAVTKINPFVKVSYSLAFSLMPLLFTGLITCSILLAVTILVLALSRVPLGRIKGFFIAGTGMIQFFALFNMLFNYKPGTHIVTWPWGLELTWGGIVWAVAIDLRYLTMLSSAIFFFLTTRDRDIALMLSTLKAPRAVTFYTTLFFRSLGVVLDDLYTIRMALQSRGFSFDTGPILERMRNYASLFIPLIGVSLMRADEMNTAATMRRFGMTSVTPTTFNRISFRPLDYGAIAVVVAVFAMSLVLAVFTPQVLAV